jgi:hypothetical protein
VPHTAKVQQCRQDSANAQTRDAKDGHKITKHGRRLRHVNGPGICEAQTRNHSICRLGLMNADDVKELLDYDRETGEFYWKSRPHNISKRFIGKRAGTISLGYLRISLDGKLVLAHRLVWLMEHGEWPRDHIDHINRNKMDNRIGNLRDATQSQNMRNASLPSNNKSGIAGVSWNKVKNSWEVYIGVGQRKRTGLGYKKDFFEACCLRKSAENQHGYNAYEASAA